MGRWFSTRLREAREGAGLSQLELSQKLNVSGATISNWENRASEPRSAQREAVEAWLERHDGPAPRGRPPSRASSRALKALEDVYRFWPQSRIAEALSVSQATISNWLRTGNVPEDYAKDLTALQHELLEDTEGARTTGGTSPAPEADTTYASWLRSSLEEADINALDLAKQSGVHVNTLLALLEGRTEKPQERTRTRIQKALSRLAKSEPAKARSTLGEPEPEPDNNTWYYVGLEFTRDEIDQVPNEPGVYVIHDRLGRPSYVGVAHKGKGGIRGRLRKHDEARWSVDRKVAYSFSYAVTSRMPSHEPSNLAVAIEKILIKFMGNAMGAAPLER